MSKELFIAAHEQLIEQYLERHPNSTEAEAYEKTADGAYDPYRDNLADMADRARDRAKYERSSDETLRLDTNATNGRLLQRVPQVAARFICAARE